MKKLFYLIVFLPFIVLGQNITINGVVSSDADALVGVLARPG